MVNYGHIGEIESYGIYCTIVHMYMCFNIYFHLLIFMCVPWRFPKVTAATHKHVYTFLHEMTIQLLCS